MTLIPSDSESADRSDTPFALLEELVTLASKEFKDSGVAGAGMCLNLASHFDAA